MKIRRILAYQVDLPLHEGSYKWSGDILVADANTGWLMHEAAKVVRRVSDVDVYIEQPCLSYDECLSIRRRTNHPFVLDESIDGIDMLLRGHQDDAMDVVNIKISKFFTFYLALLWIPCRLTRRSPGLL